MELLPGIFQIKSAIDCRRLKHAQRTLSQVLVEQPNNPDYLFLNGFVQYLLNLKEEARAQWEYVRILSPQHPGVARWLSKIDEAPNDDLLLAADDFEANLSGRPPRFNPFRLCFRPKQFFSRDIIFSRPVWLFLSMWLLGFFIGFLKLTTYIVRMLETGVKPADVPIPFVQSWTAFWLWLIPLCSIGGFCLYITYGLAFRIFLRICGAKSPDIYLSRRVMLYPSLLVTVPFLIISVVESFVYDNPLQYMMDEELNWLGWLYLVVVIGWFWSIYVGYRGMRCCFATAKWRTRILVFIVPALLLVVGVIIGIAYEIAKGVEKPDINKPIGVELDGFSLQYPSNWTIESDDDTYEAFTVESDVEDVSVSFSLYKEPIDVRKESDDRLTLLGISKEYLGLKPIEKWGKYTGFGYAMDFEEEGTNYKMVIFASSTEDSGFSVLQYCEESIEAEMTPALTLIQDTFELKKTPVVKTSDLSATLTEKQTP